MGIAGDIGTGLRALQWRVPVAAHPGGLVDDVYQAGPGLIGQVGGARVFVEGGDGVRERVAFDQVADWLQTGRAGLTRQVGLVHILRGTPPRHVLPRELVDTGWLPTASAVDGEINLWRINDGTSRLWDPAVGTRYVLDHESMHAGTRDGLPPDADAWIGAARADDARIEHLARNARLETLPRAEGVGLLLTPGPISRYAREGPPSERRLAEDFADAGAIRSLDEPVATVDGRPAYFGELFANRTRELDRQVGAW